MKVKTLKPHRNAKGSHRVGDEYETNHPKAAIKFGYVEELGPEARTVEDLKSEADDRNIELPKKGRGKSGGVVKADIVEAVTEA